MIVLLKKGVLKDGLPKDLVIVSRKTVQLNPDIETDLAELRELLGLAQSTFDPSLAGPLRKKILRFYGTGLAPIILDDWIKPLREELDEEVQSVLEHLRAIESGSKTLSAGQHQAHGSNHGWEARTSEAQGRRESQQGMDLFAPTSGRTEISSSHSAAFSDGAGGMQALPEPLTKEEARLGIMIDRAEEAEAYYWSKDNESYIEEIAELEQSMMESLNWAIENEKTKEAARLAGALWPAWVIRKNLRGGRRPLEQLLLQMEHDRSPIYAKVVHGAGALALIDGDLLMAELRMQEASQLWREIGNAERYARALHCMGIIHFRRGDFEQADRNYDTALTVLEGVKLPEARLQALIAAIDCAHAAGNLSRKTILVDELERVADQVGNDRCANLAKLHRILPLVDKGQYQAAFQLAETVLGRAKELDSAIDIAIAQRLLGHVNRFVSGEPQLSIRLFEGALAIFERLNDRFEQATTLYHLASLQHDLEQLDQMAQNLSRSHELYIRCGYKPGIQETRDIAAQLHVDLKPAEVPVWGGMNRTTVP